MDFEELNTTEYVGFWRRAAASIVDTLLVVVVTGIVLYATYGDEYIHNQDKMYLGTMDLIMQTLFPLAFTLAFWFYLAATPGKLLLSAKIIDARSGQAATRWQLFGRYFAYFVSIIPLGFGFIWIAFDKRKQGWHDKLAKTLVIRNMDID